MPSASINVPLLKESQLSQSIVQRLSASASFEETSGAQFRMTAGAVLLAPEGEELRIQTPQGEVLVAAGCRALLHIKNGYVALFNLHDKHAGQVRIRSFGQTIDTSIGQEILIGADRSGFFSDFNPTPEISVRDVKTLSFAPGKLLFRAEFSIVSALLNHQTLKGLKLSQDAEHKKHMKQLLKNALVLNYITAKHGTYKSGQVADQTNRN